MSIVPLVRVTVLGMLRDKSEVMADLQALGCLHLIPLAEREQRQSVHGPSPQSQAALRFLQSSPQRRRQSHNPARFNAEQVERRALDLQRRLQELADERDFLRHRIAELRPWGDFHLPELASVASQRLWFYIVPHHDMAKVEASNLVWEMVSRDPRHAYVVVLCPDEPHGMPVERTRTGARPLSELLQRLEDVELEIEDRQAERAALTRWCGLFSRSLNRLQDRANLAGAMGITYDSAPLFAVQGWAPLDRLRGLQQYAHKAQLALATEGPGPDDHPPTLLRNAQLLQAGQQLVGFYMTPGYWLWDPSSTVFFSFSIFFAMILSDAGYAALMAAGLALGWKKLGATGSGRWLRVLFAALVGTSLGWGVLVGSYFGMDPGSGTWLGQAKLLNMSDSTTMMTLSILVGVAHVVLANLADVWRRRWSLMALAPLGWCALLLGSLVLWWGRSGAGAVAEQTGVWTMAAGAAAVLLFTGGRGPLGRRFLQGLLALTKISSAFGDVLSYLRLFALGLASASLALAFNDLAGQVAAAAPGFGKLFAFLILLIGHGLNLVLGITSGFIHGLRLNFIEFFNWSVPEEGYPFRAFARKESSPWSP